MARRRKREERFLYSVDGWVAYRKTTPEYVYAVAVFVQPEGRPGGWEERFAGSEDQRETYKWLREIHGSPGDPHRPPLQIPRPTAP